MERLTRGVVGAAIGGALAWAAAAGSVGAQPPGAAAAETAPGRPLDLTRYRWRNRLLLLFAPSAEDSAYRAEAAALRDRGDGVRERDLLVAVVLERGSSAFDGRPLAAGDAATLRRRFRTPAGRFTAVLVGKDGRAALRSGAPVVAGRLFPAIDAMPMRRAEARRGRTR